MNERANTITSKDRVNNQTSKDNGLQKKELFQAVKFCFEQHQGKTTPQNNNVKSKQEQILQEVQAWMLYSRGQTICNINHQMKK